MFFPLLLISGFSSQLLRRICNLPSVDHLYSIVFVVESPPDRDFLPETQTYYSCPHYPGPGHNQTHPHGFHAVSTLRMFLIVFTILSTLQELSQGD